MDITAILGLVAQLVPTAKIIIDSLTKAQAVPSPTQDILDIIASLLPVATQLMATVNAIKGQTQANYPQVWATVQADYADASAKFDALNK